MRLLHVVTPPVVAGGLEAHLARFVARSEAEGVENAHVEDLRLESLAHARPERWLLDETGLSGPPDLTLLHTRRAWAQADTVARLGATAAWVHDYAFVCPATISWFRNTREPCHLPLGVHCVTNAYTKWCNARHPVRNLSNVLEVRRTLRASGSLAAVIVASEFARARLADGGIDPARVDVIPYFVDLPDDAEDGRPQGGPVTALYIGRLSEVKGIDVLLAAWARVPRDWELVIAGDGYLRGELEALARDLTPDRSVRFVGYVSDDEARAALYRSADFVVMPSLWPEPFGIVGLEALAHGRPVVATDVGGISDWLDDGLVGLLARPDDAADLADKMTELGTNPELAARMGRRGRDHVAAVFCWQEHWLRFRAVMERAKAVTRA